MRIFAALFGLAAGAALAWGIAQYPFGWIIPVACSLVYGLVLLRWPAAWLLILPALLPVLDLARFTGGTLVTDSDLLILLTITLSYLFVAVGYRPRAAPSAQLAGLSFVPGLLLLLLLVSYGISAWRGFTPYLPMDEQLADYHSRWNALRIAKGYGLPLLLLPPLIGTLRAYGAKALNLMGWGFAASLGTVTLACVYERVAFPGFLNFSADYRITGPFWEMNVGGAALDGWLALTLPFAIWGLLRARGILAYLVVGLLAALAFYAALVTFSRGVYAACFVSLLVGALSWASGGALREGGQRKGAFLAGAVVLGAVAWGALSVFQHGGYRTLAAYILILPALHLTAVASHRSGGVPRLVGGVVFVLIGAAQWAAFALLDKGAYVAFGVSALLFVGAALMWARNRQAGRGLLIGLFLAMVMGMGLCAYHWGGQGALTDALWTGGGLLAVFLLISLREQPLPAWSPRQSLAMLGVSLGVCVAVVVPGGYYMGSRFATSQHDMGTREKHWRDSMSWLDGDTDWAIGKGLGRYPETAFWRSSREEAPGSYALPAEKGEHFLRLMSASHMLGWGEVLRLTQAISPSSSGTLEFRAEVRSKQDVRIFAEVCVRNLIYALDCAIKNVDVKGLPDVWQPIRAELAPVPRDLGLWYAPRPPVFAVALESTSSTADIRRIQLLDPSYGEMLRNGDFAAAENFWFSTSDRDHLPWHAKSLPLNVLFDQGLFGLSLFTVLWCAVLLRLAARSSTWDMAPFLLASFSGFFVVGLFDSLIDVPRLAVLFYLMCFISIVVRPEHAYDPPEPVTIET